MMSKCRRCFKALTFKNKAHSIGFSGYCQKCAKAIMRGEMRKQNPHWL